MHLWYLKQVACNLFQPSTDSTSRSEQREASQDIIEYGALDTYPSESVKVSKKVNQQCLWPPSAWHIIYYPRLFTSTKSTVLAFIQDEPWSRPRHHMHNMHVVSWSRLGWKLFPSVETLTSVWRESIARQRQNDKPIRFGSTPLSRRVDITVTLCSARAATNQIASRERCARCNLIEKIQGELHR